MDTIFGESVWSIGGNGCMNPYPFPIIQLPMEEKDTDSTQHVIRVPHKQAGFLAYGSSYWPRLPRRSCNPRFSEQWWRISPSSQWLYMETIYYWPISFSSQWSSMLRLSSPITAMAGLRWLLTTLSFYHPLKRVHLFVVSKL